jgi:transposase
LKLDRTTSRKIYTNLQIWPPKRRSLERRLPEILFASSRCDLTRDLQAKIGYARNQLLVVLDHPGTVEIINNGCERLLRSPA